MGEAILLPILDKFNLTNKQLGQTIISIGTVDDIIEVLIVIIATIFIGHTAGHAPVNVWLNLLVLAFLLGLVYLLVRFHNAMVPFRYKNIHSVFLFVIFFIFLFVGIGELAEAGALGALLSGLALRNILPKGILRFIDSEIKTMAYGLFAPIFFLWVGLSIELEYFIMYPLLILLLIIVTNTAKIAGSYIMGSSILGKKRSFLLGLGLCAKFSTSIVIIKIFHDKGIINPKLYSVLIGAMMAFTLFIPVIMSLLIDRWHIDH